MLLSAERTEVSLFAKQGFSGFIFLLVSHPAQNMELVIVNTVKALFSSPRGVLFLLLASRGGGGGGGGGVGGIFRMSLVIKLRIRHKICYVLR